MLSVVYGILAAASWGGGDFAGGLSSRKLGALKAVFLADIFGVVLLVGAQLFLRETLPSPTALAYAVAAGIIGTIGLLALYHALVVGRMSIATPVSALLAAVLPVAFSAVTEGLPDWLQLTGFALALLAVWFISQSDESMSIAGLKDLGLPFLAGLGFGAYFVLIHRATTEATVWPMIFSRSAGGLVLFVLMLVRRESFAVPRHAWSVVTINTVLDIAGNTFYVLAGQAGRLDVAAVLASLYPGVTVLLAAGILKEHVRRIQWGGIGLALLAIALMTI